MNAVHDHVAPVDMTGSDVLINENIGLRIVDSVVLVRAFGPVLVTTNVSKTVSHVKRYGLSAYPVIDRSAVCIRIVVETVFDVLFPVEGSSVAPVIEAVLVSDHELTITRPVIVNDPVVPLARLPAL